jgi:rare lipoprotein A
LAAILLSVAPVAVAAEDPAPGEGARQEGQASYFRGGQDGNTRTATGEPVDPRSDTAASRDLPLGSEATVTNKQTGQSVDVRITDRGPARQDRVIDLSEKAAEDIGMERTGVAPVTVEPKRDGRDPAGLPQDGDMAEGSKP